MLVDNEDWPPANLYVLTSMNKKTKKSIRNDISVCLEHVCRS